jgi:hypothetical protein
VCVGRLNTRDLCKTMRADNRRPKPCFTLCSSSSCIDGFHQSLRPSRFGGRPKRELRALIRRINAENPLRARGAFQSELLKLGFEFAQSTLWTLRNHAPDITAMDLLVAPSIGFVQLYVLVIVRLERRKLVCINVTPHPTAEWIARQVRGIPLGSSPALPDPRSVNVREV